MPVAPSTHSLFWLCGALFIVGAFLAVGGILRRTLSVTDRSSRLIATTGIVLALGGLAGALTVASTAPGSTVAVMKEMVGLGSAVVPSPAPPPKPGVQQVQVTGVDFKFQPSTISIKAAKKIDVVFRNASSSSPHTFTIEGGPSFELKAEPGGSESGVLRGLRPGTYQFICSIPGHVQLGMKGTLVVR
jgi:plastocyanin